jgi:hypothetical protein
MVVAMVAMRVVQAAIHEVVDVVAMRHGLVPAAGTVDVACFVSAAVLICRAVIWVRRADLDDVLVDMVAVGVMQVAVMQVVHVVPVAYGGMPAARAVFVVVVRMMRRFASVHGAVLCLWWPSRNRSESLDRITEHRPMRLPITDAAAADRTAQHHATRVQVGGRPVEIDRRDANAGEGHLALAARPARASCLRRCRLGAERGDSSGPGSDRDQAGQDQAACDHLRTLRRDAALVEAICAPT